MYQAMKELTGFARPKIMENFTSHIQLHMVDKGESWEISKVYLTFTQLVDIILITMCLMICRRTLPQASIILPY